VVAKGDRRFRVVSWLEEDPYPRAEVEFLGEFPSDEVEISVLESAEKVVRDTLSYLLELDLSVPWPTDIELADDPVARAWQLAGIAPLGTLDHQDLLESDDVASLLRDVEQTVTAALEVFKMTRESGE
jgi:Lon protease-like protein